MRTDDDIFSLFDPELREAARTRPTPRYTLETLEQIRRMPMAPASVLPPPAPQPIERMIPGPPGAPDVKVVVVSAPSSDRPRPAFLHMHGGGFVIGAATAANAARLQTIAAHHDCVVVSVDYRLAPETRFPGSLEDNYAALSWLHRNGESLGVDPSRIAVGGESAGGGHAAVLAIAARNRGEFPIAFQLLLYPMLDDRTGVRRAAPRHQGTVGWTRASNRFGWSALLGVEAGSAIVPEGAVPARVRDLTGLAPAFIGIGGLDLLVEENIAYARRLLACRVATELMVVPGAFHAFDVFAPTASRSQAFTNAWNDALSRAFRE